MKNRRSILSVPGHIEKMHVKAMNSEADCIQFDLEDSVPLTEKESAFKCILNTINNNDFSLKSVSLRLNSFQSQNSFFEMQQLPLIIAKLDYLVLPKVDTAEDVIFIDKYISILENSFNQKFKVKFDISIETANGFENLNEITKSSNRVAALVFGVADYSRSIGVKNFSLSGHGEDDYSDFGFRWSWAFGRLVNIAKANNLEAIDAPFGDFKSPDKLKKAVSHAAFLGMTGKWAIHPNQISIINECFGYSDIEIENAKRIVKLYEEAEKNNVAALSVEGKMIDTATYNLACSILNKI